MRRLGLALVVATAVVVAACGSTGSATPRPSDAAAAGATEPSAATEAADAEASEAAEEAPNGQSAEPGTAGGSGGDGSIPTIADGIFSGGSARVSFSGDKTLETDATLGEGQGVAVPGLTNLRYELPSNGGWLEMTFMPTEPSGMAVTVGDLVTGGTWGQDCDVSFGRNDASGLTGTFACRGVQAIDGASKVYTVDVAGSFTAER